MTCAQVFYHFMKQRGWKKRTMEFLSIHLEFFGAVLGLVSVAGTAGVRIGDLPIQVVRFSWAGPTAIYLLIAVLLIRQDLIIGTFKD